MQGNFLRLRCDHYTVKWERHTEFTRYSIVQTLPAHAGWGETLPELAAHVAPGTDWLRGLPGQTMAAIHMGMLPANLDPENLISTAQAWLGEGVVLASRMGNTTEGLPHSCILTHFRIGADGFERMLVLAPEALPVPNSGCDSNIVASFALRVTNPGNTLPSAVLIPLSRIMAAAAAVFPLAMASFNPAFTRLMVLPVL
jgi:hypothetical protein